MSASQEPQTSPAPGSSGITANAGLRLFLADHSLDAEPNGPPPAKIGTVHCPDDPDAAGPSARIEVPLIPAALIQNAAGFLRLVRRQGSGCARWLLYLHWAQGTWHPFLPPQLCGENESRLDCSFAGCEVPGPELRLAGTFSSTPAAQPEDLWDYLPVSDGIHLFMHTDNWLRLTAFVVAGGTPYLMTLDQVLREVTPKEYFDLISRIQVTGGDL